MSAVKLARGTRCSEVKIKMVTTHMRSDRTSWRSGRALFITTTSRWRKRMMRNKTLKVMRAHATSTTG